MSAPWTGTIGITDEHLELHAAARRWVEANVDVKQTKAMLDTAPDQIELPAFWPSLRELGWLGLHLAEEHGGEGYSFAELVVVLEELGRACTPGPFLPTVITSTIIQSFASDALRHALLPGLATGSRIGATAIPAGNPRRVVWVEATDDGDGALVLDGTAEPVLGGGWADVLVLPARVDGDDTEVVWCVIERAVAGDALRVVTRPSTDATRPVAAVTVTGLTVDADHQLRQPVVGTVVADVAATLLGAESVGASAWCVETAATYAQERVQFGRPIGQFQAVKHRCANLLLGLERARATVWDAARAASTPGATAGERQLAACVAGATAPTVFFDGAKDCIQVLGGIGYTWEHDAHLYIKRATALRQLLGPDTAWDLRIAAMARQGIRRPLRVELPPEAEPRRDAVRAFVEATQAKDKSEWTRAIADGGYLVPYWPAPWGRDADPLEQLVIDEEFDRARLRRPHLQVAAWVLPTLIAHATPEQQERWIRPTLHGQILWCQLFSEPGAGSDLASLATKAVRDDERGGWVLNGQKVWTTMAHIANWGICLARTDQDVPKHEGITCFLLDMTTPGIDIRPLRELTGAELFNEVFFNDVFVPDDCVVGAVDDGWEAARTTLANERVSMGSGSSFGPAMETVLSLLPAADAPEHDDPETAVALAEVGGLLATGHAVAVLGLRTTLRALAGAKPGPESSVRKLIGVEHEQHVQEVGLALLGQQATVTDGLAAMWVNGFLGNRALSIAGGTSDVQRNIIAERLLGLPKDPEPGS